MKKVFLFIALVSVFAACQPEDLKTIFTSENAQLTINVTTVINSVNQKTVTDEAQWEPVNVVGNPDIPAGTAKISATYNGAKGETEVGYPRILADTAPVVLGATVYIPGSVGDYTFDVKQVIDLESKQPTGAKFVLDPAKNHAYSHAGYSNWAENASDYTLSDSCTYDEMDVDAVTSTKAEVFEDQFKDIIDGLFETTVASMTDNTKKDQVYEFEVPAWSIYTVVNTVYAAPVKYYVLATPDANAPKLGKDLDGFESVVGTFEGPKTFTELFFDKEEHPTHAGHAGHGGHGNGSNAGGGLVPAE